MKKNIVLFLIVSFSLTLFACGSKTDTNQPEEPTTTIITKEELMKQAKEVDAGDINNDSFDNLVKAKNDYCNQVLLLDGMIKSFGDNYIELAGSNISTYLIDVYLPVEEMLDLKTGQSIVVVGQTSAEITGNSENIADYTFDYKHYQMPVGFLVKDTVELEGTLKGVNNSYSPAYNIEFSGNNVLKLIYFKEGVDTSSFDFGTTIKFSAKAIYENNDWRYYDAELIE